MKETAVKIHKFLLICFVLLGFELSNFCCKSKETPRFNFILISIDTLRADHLQSYGYLRKTSPNIDRIAQNSIVFNQAISQSSWTLPAHVSMMTGLFSGEHGLLYYDDEGLEDKKRFGIMDRKLPTLANILKKHGYETVSFNGGAWIDSRFGLGKGFKIYEWGGRYFADNVPKSIEWIKANKKSNFFLFLHAYDCHHPFNAEKRFNIFDEYSGDRETKELIAQFQSIDEIHSPEYQYIVSQYDAGIRRADYYLGQLFDFLEVENLMDKTVLVITSDHGEMLLERHGRWGHIYPLYEELIHVPLIIKIPGRTGSRVQKQVPASVSILPTILDIAGIKDKNSREEFNLMRIFREKDFSFDYILSETGRKMNARLCRSLRSEDWKLTYYSQEKQESQLELFNMRTDKLEQDNMVKDNPNTVRDMLNKFNAFGFKRKSKNSERILDEKTLQKIKSLGYLK